MHSNLKHRLMVPALALAGLALLPACTPVGVVAGLGTAGMAAMQERGITGATRDVSLEMAIHTKLLQEAPGLVPHVGVDVYGAQVLLTGAVDTEDKRAEAIRLAWSVAGVTDVYNEIEVTETAGILDKSRDAWITTQISGLLAMEKGVKSRNYSPTTHNRVVYLMGIAQDQEELDKVLARIETVAYVRKVVNHMKFKKRTQGGGNV